MQDGYVFSRPPGPRGALWQTIRYVRNPLAFYLDAVARFGDAFTVPSVLGRVVVISCPADVRALFALPMSAFERWSVDAVAPLLGANSVLLTSGAAHHQQRRMMAPAFHRERIHAAANGIGAVVQSHAERWPTDVPFDLQNAIIELSIDIILTTVLGIRDLQVVSRYRAAILGTLSAMGPTLMLTRAISERLANVTGTYARFKHALAALDRLLYAEIDAPPDAKSPDSMLAVLRSVQDASGRGFTREELRDQLMTLIFAGHETSAIGIVWGIHWLAHTPRTYDLLIAELDAAKDRQIDTLTRLPYLDAVCKETLRLHPVVPEVIRRLTAPLPLARWILPAGTPVVACIAAVHHRPELYAAPTQFDPQRFIDRDFGAHEYLPFGGGVHRCPGEAFALLEMKAILANLLATWRFELVSTRASTPRLRSITMEPRDGLRVVMRRRGQRA